MMFFLINGLMNSFEEIIESLKVEAIRKYAT